MRDLVSKKENTERTLPKECHLRLSAAVLVWATGDAKVTNADHALRAPGLHRLLLSWLRGALFIW